MWQEELYSKFVNSEDNPLQDNYGECFLDGDPLELETFITSLLKKQREICGDVYLRYESTYEPKTAKAILNAPEPKEIK